MTAGFTSRRILAIAVLIGGASLTACEEDPVGIGHDEGDVTGFVLRAACECPGGGEFIDLYQYRGPTDPDTLELQESQVIEVEIVWHDADGEVVTPDPDEHSWVFENNSNAMSFTPSATDPWSGTITTVALQPGATVYGAFRVFLFHGEEEEFRTDGIVSAVSAN